MKLRLMISFLVVMLGMTGAAFAISYFPPITGFQDDALEWFYDSDDDGLISVGDRLYGVLEMVETFSVLPAGQSALIGPNHELTGVFDMVVSEITPFQSPMGDFHYIDFVPNNASTILSPAAPAGTIISLFLDNSPDLDAVAATCDSFASCHALASDGNSYMDLGFAGDPDEAWSAFTLPGALDPNIVAAGPSSTVFGMYNFLLSVLTNNTDMIIGEQPVPVPQFGANGGDDLIQVVGSGNILGGKGLENDAFSRSDIDAQIPMVPEPSTLIMLGAGLLGLGIVTRRRMK